MKKRTIILTTLTIFTLSMTGCQTSSNEDTVRVPEQTNTENQMTADAPADSSTNSAENTENSSRITEEKAKDIALSDAGVKKSELTNIRIEKDIDDGIDVYDIDFYVGNKEYDYEIDAASGQILSQDSEIEDDFLDKQQNTASSSNLISKEKAAKIVLNKVKGASEQNLHIELDRDDGQDIYEGEIRYNGMEYDFELNAKNGNILEWSKEREDD